jgi:hypothetical protein
VFFAASAKPEDPPADLVRKVAARETKTAEAESNYTYRQTVTIEEMDNHGLKSGEYSEVRNVVFSPKQERTEEFVGKPRKMLVHLQLTDEDFRDIREVQPFQLTTDHLFIYETKFRGEELIDGIDCWVLQVRPRQILQAQRLFDGVLWIDKRDYSIIRSNGQAVPQIVTMKSENLFPHFTTIREQVDGGFWFPVKTFADDTLPFRSGPLRIRMSMNYSNYQRFSAESTITFGK